MFGHIVEFIVRNVLHNIVYYDISKRYIAYDSYTT